MPITFKITTHTNYIILHFELANVLAPADLLEMRPPDPVTHNFSHKGVILSGRGPVWLYGFLVHFYHPTRWVATYAPRLQGAVVVESHHLSMQVGTLIPIKSPVT